jgi:hypothetical protein
MNIRLRGHTLGLRDAGFVLLCLVSVFAVLLGQLVSLVVFDTSGLDRFVPSVLIYTVVPALLVTLLPTATATRLYARRTVVSVAVAVFVAALSASLFTINFLLIG